MLLVWANPGALRRPLAWEGVKTREFSRALRKLAADQMTGADGFVRPFAIFKIRSRVRSGAPLSEKA